MKRRLESNLDTDPPCGLPSELWEHHIVPRHASWRDMQKHFITMRSLRCTCVWFARHIALRTEHTAHALFWPNVEYYAKKDRADILRALEWPTHPRVMLTTGYGSENYSYGRAGSTLARRGDVETLMVLARHGGEYWTRWVVDGIEMGHIAVLEALYASGLRYMASESTFIHDSPRVMAIVKNRLDMLRIVDKIDTRTPVSSAYKSMAIKHHCDRALLDYIGVTPKDLRARAWYVLGWTNDYAHIEYILDHYWTQRPTRATQTRAQRLCALVTKRLLYNECKYINTRNWAESMGVVFDAE